MSQERLQEELDEISKDRTYRFKATLPNKGDMYRWLVTYSHGQTSSPILVEARFPQDYPTNPPKIKVMIPGPRLPGINPDGSTDLAILKDKWSPALTAGNVLDAIDSLLRYPNANDPRLVYAAPEPYNNVSRLKQDLVDLYNDSVSSFSLGVRQDDEPGRLRLWNATMFGPASSPYKGGLFLVDIAFPVLYPFKPPVIRFQTKIYHPNILENVPLAMDLLGPKWSENVRMPDVFRAVLDLLASPYPEGPYVRSGDIAQIYSANQGLYNKTATEWTEKFAM